MHLKPFIQTSFRNDVTKKTGASVTPQTYIFRGFLIHTSAGTPAVITGRAVVFLGPYRLMFG
jgi:hypothetical protein